MKARSGKTDRGKRKGAGARPTRKAKRTAGVLDKMSPGEQAGILRTLLERHPELRREAEAEAVEMMSAPSEEDVAEDVFDAVSSLSIEALNGRAGKQPFGYVEPGEAAWEILEEAVEGFVADMKRRATLGLIEAATVICCGIVLGLHRAEHAGSKELLEWAPDFPSEAACNAVVELMRSFPAAARESVRAHLLLAAASREPNLAVVAPSES